MRAARLQVWWCSFESFEWFESFEDFDFDFDFGFERFGRWLWTFLQVKGMMM